jgi:hypothetical protein
VPAAALGAREPTRAVVPEDAARAGDLGGGGCHYLRFVRTPRLCRGLQIRLTRLAKRVEAEGVVAVDVAEGVVVAEVVVEVAAEPVGVVFVADVVDDAAEGLVARRRSCAAGCRREPSERGGVGGLVSAEDWRRAARRGWVTEQAGGYGEGGHAVGGVARARVLSFVCLLDVRGARVCAESCDGWEEISSRFEGFPKNDTWREKEKAGEKRKKLASYTQPDANRRCSSCRTLFTHHERR